MILVPALASRDPLQIDDVLARRLVAPLGRDAHGDFHLLGTDRFGRDLFVRMMLAGRLSLLVGVDRCGTVRCCIGTLVGALAGWRRGVLDRSLMALADSFSRCRASCCCSSASRSGRRGSRRFSSCWSQPDGWALRGWCAPR